MFVCHYERLLSPTCSSSLYRTVMCPFEVKASRLCNLDAACDVPLHRYKAQHSKNSFHKVQLSFFNTEFKRKALCL